jgi:hypothetical protein
MARQSLLKSWTGASPGTVIVPAFNIGRTQDFLYEIESLTHEFGAEPVAPVVQRSRIGDVARGHVSVFSIDALVSMAARVNLYPVRIAA